ncbi:MAG: hypothetical protein AAGI50_08935 [Pseudomonadota bacterium]
MLDRLRARLPDLSLTRRVTIPVYMVHNSGDPEDYFFLVDFEAFVARSREGLFVRPQLKILAGRDDFNRQTFARQFREVFAQEFDAMRAALAAEKGRRGWLDWDLGLAIAPNLIGGLIANIILAIALRLGRTLLPDIRLPGWVRGRSAETKLEDEIAGIRDRVDSALETIEIALHRELYAHAWSGGAPGPMRGMDHAAWPLPDYVRDHLTDRKSGAWW